MLKNNWITMIYNELSIWIINNPIDKPKIYQFKNEYQKIFYRESLYYR